MASASPHLFVKLLSALQAASHSATLRAVMNTFEHPACKSLRARQMVGDLTGDARDLPRRSMKSQTSRASCHDSYLAMQREDRCKVGQCNIDFGRHIERCGTTDARGLWQSFCTSLVILSMFGLFRGDPVLERR